MKRLRPNDDAGPPNTPAWPTPPKTIPVLLPLPLNKTYDYLIDPALDPGPGAFVQIPFGARLLTGIVWDRPDRGAEDASEGERVDPARLKPISAILDIIPLPAELRRFVEWVADYNVAPLGNVLRLCLRALPSVPGEKRATGYSIPPELWASARDRTLPLTAARQRVFAVLSGKDVSGTDPSGADLTSLSPSRDGRTEALILPGAVLAAQSGCSLGVIQAMAKAGLLRKGPIPGDKAPPLADPRYRPPLLSPDQTRAADLLRELVTARQFDVAVLDGVTGSGKTEVYFEAIAQALEAGRQVLVLLPEIALGTSWRDRFQARFGCPPAMWHSDVPSPQRRKVRDDLAHGRAPLVVGARSALFLPFQDLGLIIVDEEHDTSFKQEDGVIYHGRDMAVVRGQLCDIPVILASATPSLETLANVDRGRYRHHLRLPERHQGARLPAIELLDLRRHKPERQNFLAPPLVDALRSNLELGEQSMLFLNRRGYAPLTLCRGCGYRVECPHCTAWLVEHRLLGKLICHHCGHMAAPPEICPACGDRHSFVPCGPGIERLAEEVSRRFPAARMAVMASDTLERPSAAADLLHRVTAHEIDILIGTQIVAKGHHFPLLTLVGVVDADLGLSGGDLRAAERTYQLLHQVAGRAGRADRPGRVMLQTYDPAQPVMQALLQEERDSFLRAEMESRRLLNMPPYGRLGAVIVSALSADQADEAARAIAHAVPHVKGVDILGPAPAPLAVLRGRHRRRFLVKAGRQVKIQAVILAWFAALRFPASIRVQIDIDPYNFL